jgi:hypothetical protein
VVAFTFDRLNLRARFGGGDLALGHVDEDAAAFDGLEGVLFEVVEERLFSGQKAHLAGLYRRVPRGCQSRSNAEEPATILLQVCHKHILERV